MKYKFGNVTALPQIDKEILKDMGLHILKKDDTLPYRQGYTIANVYNYDNAFFIFEDNNGDMIIFDTIEDITDNSREDLRNMYVSIYDMEPDDDTLDQFAVMMKDNFTIYSGNKFPGCIQLVYKKATNQIFVKFIQMRDTCDLDRKCGKGTASLFLKIFSFLNDLKFTGDVYLDDDAKVGEKQTPLFLLNIVKGKKNVSLYQDYDFEIAPKNVDRVELIVREIRSRKMDLEKIPSTYVSQLSLYLEDMRNSDYRKTLKRIQSTC